MTGLGNIPYVARHSTSFLLLPPTHYMEGRVPPEKDRPGMMNLISPHLLPEGGSSPSGPVIIFNRPGGDKSINWGAMHTRIILLIIPWLTMT